MTDALIVAALGAVFNAGVIWGSLRAWTGRIENAEKSANRAHQRIDNLRNHAT